MNQFEEIKNEILERARKARACSGQYKRAYQSENIETLCDVIKDNFWWCCRNDVLDGELIDNYGEIFSENKIYHNVSVKNGFLLVSSNSTVEAYDSSTVNAHYDSTVKAYNISTVEAYDNSTVEAYNISTVNAHDDSTVKAYDSSTVNAHDDSTVKAYDSSTVNAHDDSTVKAYNISTVEAYNKSYINCCSTVECVIKDNSIVRRWDLNTIQYASDKLKFEKILA